MSNFEIGDIVSLKSEVIAQNQMVVSGVTGNDIECIWYASKAEEYRFKVFPADTLTRW